MQRRPWLFASDVLYHVFVRGNHKQRTFLKAQDYHAYLERLARYRQKYQVTLYAYCLMPNHVHLLLECSAVPLNRFMQGSSSPIPNTSIDPTVKSVIYSRDGTRRYSVRKMRI